MKTRTEYIVKQQELDIFKSIKRVLDSVDKFNLPEDHLISCHEICHAVAKIYNLRVETGYYMPGFEHSWLMTTSFGEQSPFDNIIEVYPVGTIGGPIFIENNLALFMKKSGMYKPANLPNVNIESKDFKSIVAIIEKTLCRAR